MDAATGTWGREPGKAVPKILDIIVVDDNPEILLMFEEILDLEGHRVRTFEDGKPAISEFRDRPADLVISDLGMPEMTGWQVAQKIRQYDAKVPIVFITAVGEYVDPEKIVALGVLTVLRKPFRLAEVRDILAKITP
jgi:CheY-like chemotaxis protein